MKKDITYYFDMDKVLVYESKSRPDCLVIQITDCYDNEFIGWEVSYKDLEDLINEIKIDWL